MSHYAKIKDERARIKIARTIEGWIAPTRITIALTSKAIAPTSLGTVATDDECDRTDKRERDRTDQRRKDRTDTR
jgi:hypothetical protein